ncbi:DUF6944 family repetitive protein [Psychrobacillus sp.]|uniref:DUF6944 family repetitive protein n=1 Tax=Psychrobacillus sp. TaxID=1871623 RepID=UPI0037CACFBD
MWLRNDHGSTKGLELVPQGNAIEDFGNSFQVAGNITNTVATDIDMNTSKEEGAKLNAVGSGIQGFGAVMRQ